MIWILCSFEVSILVEHGRHFVIASVDLQVTGAGKDDPRFQEMQRNASGAVNDVVNKGADAVNKGADAMNKGAGALDKGLELLEARLLKWRPAASYGDQKGRAS